MITENAGVDRIMVALPMLCTSNIIYAASPVTAMVIIVLAIIRVNPLVLIKRTAVPLRSGFVSVLALSLIRYM